MSVFGTAKLGRLVALAAGAALFVLPSTAGAVAPITVPVPKFQTGSVSHIRGTSAQLNGSIRTEGLEITYWFAYGAKGDLTTMTKSAIILATATPPSSPVKVGQAVTDLQADEYYELVGTYVAEGKLVTLRGKEAKYDGPKAVKNRFDLGKGKKSEITVTYGGTLELPGTLTGPNNANQLLMLQGAPFPYTGGFLSMGLPTLSGRSGSFLFKVPKMTQNTEFRVLTAGTRPVYSGTTIVNVSPRITLHYRSAGRTGLYRLYGTVSPTKPGLTIVIQLLKPQRATSKRSGPSFHTAGVTVLKRATSALSRFSVIVHLTGTYHYRAYVRLPDKENLVSGHSADLLIRSHVAVKQKHKKKS